MDTGEGHFDRFESLEAAKDAKVYREKNLSSPLIHNIFMVGQELNLCGSLFRIAAIGKRFMTLKLLPQRLEPTPAPDPPLPEWEPRPDQQPGDGPYG
jgi:hypothetical protein